ncbi:MAG: hypothetical protein IT384_07195 [Deltaproteobacteria bacterium]|nr:hypothetical protein [Deltaproteobacteria bacterium]
MATALATPPAFGAGTCPIQWEGDSEALAMLFQQLARQGVDLRSADDDSGCAPLVARLERRGASLDLRLVDARGQVTVREVSSATVAAALVESWARIDLVAQLLDPPTPPIPVAPKKLHAVPARAVQEASVAEEPGGTPRIFTAAPDDEVFERSLQLPSSYALEAGPELGFAGDGSWWLGAAARARLHLDPVEPLVLVRVTHSRFQLDAAKSPASRLGVDLLVGVDLPLEVAPLEVRPGVALGAGFLDTARSEVALPECSTSCDVAPLIPDDLERSSFGLRAEAHVSAALALSSSFDLELQISGSFAPLAHTDAILPTYAASLPANERARLAIAGEPAWILRTALLLRWEAR